VTPSNLMGLTIVILLSVIVFSTLMFWFLMLVAICGSVLHRMSSTALLLSNFRSVMGLPFVRFASSKPMRDHRVKKHLETLLLGSSHGLDSRQPPQWRLSGSGAVCRRT